MCVFVCTHRKDENVPQKCNATDTAPVDSNMDYETVEYDHAYSTVDDMHQQVFVESDNLAYCNWNLEHSKHCAQQIDHGRSTIELSREQEMVTHGPQVHGAAQLKKASSAK